MIDEKKLLERIEGWKKSIESYYLTEEFLADNSIIIGTLSEVLDVINEQPKVGEWISVTERLPECYERVLVTAQDLYDQKAMVCMGCFNGHRWVIQGSTEYEAIAWMPLPEPYEEIEK